MEYTFLQLVLLFFIYAFLGWCTEVAFAACCEGRFVNRGFLNGPVCPIYGFGVVGVVLLLRPIQDNLLLLFLGSVAVTTAIEFVTGFVLEKAFHAKWWDYSDMPLNIMGYVCLLFSLLWGAACVVVVRLVHPLICGVLGLIPHPLQIVLASVFGVVMVVDIAATVAAIRKLSERVKRLSEMAAEIHRLSDEIGQAISDGTLSAKRKAVAGEEKFSEGMRRLGEMKADTEERIEQSRRTVSERFGQSRDAVTNRLEQGVDATRRRLAAVKERFAGTLEEKSFSQRRLLKAFPHLTSQRHQEGLNELRAHYERRRREKKDEKE